MKRLYCTADFVFLGYLRGVLEDAGIACHTKNEHLLGAAGDLPPTEIWPELWIINDGDWMRASRFIETLSETLNAAQDERTPWRCEQCGELLEPQFTDCWVCETVGRDEFLA